jgi:hypothetical protein
MQKPSGLFARCQATVAHACNPSNSRGRDPGQIFLETLYLEKPYHKNRTGGVAQSKGPEFKPQYHKKAKKKIFFLSAHD